MKITDTKLLAQFRGPGPCHYCGRVCRNREAAHVFSRGSGRLDFAFNLAALGGPFECSCHHKNHNGGEPNQRQLLEKVAEREGIDPVALERAVWLLRRLDRFCDERPVIARLYGTKYRPGSRVITNGTGDRGRRSGVVPVRPGEPAPGDPAGFGQEQGPDLRGSDQLRGQPPGPGTGDWQPGGPTDQGDWREL